MRNTNINTLVFDLGGVLVDWNPEYLYNKIIPDEKERRWFLSTICTGDWNEEQDAGRSLQEGTEHLVQRYPEHETAIRAQTRAACTRPVAQTEEARFLK